MKINKSKRNSVRSHLRTRFFLFQLYLLLLFLIWNRIFILPRNCFSVFPWHSLMRHHIFQFASLRFCYFKVENILYFLLTLVMFYLALNVATSFSNFKLFRYFHETRYRFDIFPSLKFHRIKAII